VVAESQFPEPFAEPNLHQQINGSLFQYASPNASDHVITAAILQDDGIDAIPLKQMAKHEASRTGTYNANLRS